MDVEQKKAEPTETKTVNLGELLIEARENRKLTAEDIANQLNLTLTIITKIEANDFDQGIPLAFIRGYVRSYAQKVGADVDMICAEFDLQTQKAEAPIQSLNRISKFTSTKREVNSSSFFFKLITFLLIGSIVVFGSWEAWKRFTASQQDNGLSNEINLGNLSQSNEDAEAELPITDSQALDSEANQEVSAQLSKTSVAEPLAESEPEASEPADLSSDSPASIEVEDEAVSASQVSTETLAEEIQPEEIKNLITGPIISAEFRFSGDCWVKVTDANGEVLAIGVKTEGKVMPLEGVAPWNIILGEPSVVSLTVKDEAYDLSRFSPGQSANFSIE